MLAAQDIGFGIDRPLAGYDILWGKQVEGISNDVIAAVFTLAATERIADPVVFPLNRHSVFRITTDRSA